jgi:NADH:ubiquinone oxidoreductase subunit E
VCFSAAAFKEYQEIVGRYPTPRAALLPTLWIVQREFGWISPTAEEYVAQLLELPPAQVSAVVSFYSMFHRLIRCSIDGRSAASLWRFV